MPKEHPVSLICPVSGAAGQYLSLLSRLIVEPCHHIQLIMITTSDIPDISAIAPHFGSFEQLRVSPAYSENLIYDRAIAAATEATLVFVRKPVMFDAPFLRQCTAAVAENKNAVYSAFDGSLIIADRNHLIENEMSLALSGEAVSIPMQPSPAPVPKRSKGTFRDLYNNQVTLEYGAGSFVDPDVIVDSPEKISIGANTIIRKGVVLRPESGEIVIGDNCVINHYCIFHAKGGIYIGDWTIIAPHCGFYAQNHSYDRFDLPITKQPNIGKGIYLMGDNWIGSHSVICDDVTLGKGAVIGANSTVTSSVAMAVIAAGSPARVIKNRFEDSWDFHQRERASTTMPADIAAYVEQRGKLLSSLVSPDDDVLDVGCGEGIITSIIGKASPRTIGCDYCRSAVNDARERFPHVEFVVSNVTHLRFGDNRFSKVIFTEVAEHLMPVQLVKAIAEIARVLRPGGTLLMTTPLTGAGSRTSTYAHIYEYSQQEIAALLEPLFGSISLINPHFGLIAAVKKG